MTAASMSVDTTSTQQLVLAGATFGQTCNIQSAAADMPVLSQTPSQALTDFDELQIAQLQRIANVSIDIYAANSSARESSNAPVTPPEETDFSHKTAFIQVLNVKELNTWLSRYVQCKNTAPATTAALVVKPKRLTKHDHVPFFKHMTLVREYPAGTCLLNGKPTKTSPLQVWFDAPLELKAGTLDDPTAHVVITGQHSCLDFVGTFAGHKGRIKVDSGASHEFISTDFIAKARLAVTPCTRSVALANGKTVHTCGTCTAPVISAWQIR